VTVLDEATALMVRLIAERDEALAEVERLRARFEALRDEMVKRSKAWDESIQPVMGDFRRDDGDIAQAHGALLEAEFVVDRLNEALPKREYIVHATVEKRVRLELLADDDQEALDDAAHAALYDDTLDVLDEQVTDTSIVWRGRDKGGEDG
jgi:hypothetical protein